MNDDTNDQQTNDDDTYVQYNPDEVGQRPYLKEAGKYGPGMEHNADITVSKFTPVRKRDELPDFMLEEMAEAVEAGRPEPRWARVGYAVVTDAGKVFVDQDVRHGKELFNLMTQLGIQQTEEQLPDGSRRTGFRTGDVVGTKVGCLDIDAPKKSKNNGLWYTGRVKQVVGV